MRIGAWWRGIKVEENRGITFLVIEDSPDAFSGNIRVPKGCIGEVLLVDAKDGVDDELDIGGVGFAIAVGIAELIDVFATIAVNDIGAG